MPAIFFNNLWMLAGLAALSVPIIIHLLLRRKKKRIRFSTLQFFVRQDERASQRRRLRNWLLLVMRLLICALLVLAFARPYLPNAAFPGGGPAKRQVVIVLDRSLSMQANAANGPKWARARESVRQILSELKPDDRAALVGCTGRAEVLSEWAPGPAVDKVVDDLQPAFGVGNLSEGIEQANRLLTFSDPKATTTIYVVSDLQKSSAQNLGSHPLAQQVEVKTVAVGDLAAPNIAIADLQCEGRDEIKPHALLASFSDEDTADLPLEIHVDGKLISTRPIRLGAGASTNVDLELPVLKPGWHEVMARLRKPDALGLDDARFQSLFVPEPARAWVAEGKVGTRTFEEESFFVVTALDPGKDSTNNIGSRFAPEKVTPDHLAARLQPRGGKLPCDLVILPALKQIPPQLTVALTSYVQAGGGLLLFLGEGISANRYNTEWNELLPGRLGEVQPCAAGSRGWAIGEFKTNELMFAAFQLPNSGDLSLPRFTKRYAVTPADGALVSARFQDGTPLMILREIGKGRVVLANTSADTDWSDWPKHKTFVPWLHGTGHYLAGLKSRGQVQPRLSFIAGTEGDVELPPGAAKQPFVLNPAVGKPLNLVASDDGQLRDMAWTAPGIYSVRDAAGNEVRRLAVNVPVAESDLTALSPNDFQQQLARASGPQQTTLAAGLFGTSGNQKELWRVLLLAVLGLLFLELFVANRTLA